MASCINIKSAEYQTMRKQSGLSDIILKAYIGNFQEEHGRWPNLDEIPNSDSSKYIKEIVKTNESGYTKIDTLLNETGTSSIEEATQLLNNQFPDKVVKILKVGDNARVTLINRPSRFKNNKPEQLYDPDQLVNSQVFISQQLEKLRNLYGINIIPMSTAEIQQQEWASQIPQASTTKAFVYQGQIYINTDIATVDSPIHEMLHILLGSMATTNPDIYYQLVDSVQQLPNYARLAKNFPNRTQSDVNEEIFVSEFAKVLSGRKSQLSNLDPKVLYELHRQIKNTLDTILMGDKSVYQMPDTVLYNSTLKEVAKYVNSSQMTSKYISSFSPDGAETHRVLANTKQRLMEEGILKEYC